MAAQKARLQVAGALRASICAELDLLRGLHLLLNDRAMTRYESHGALKLVLEQLKRCQGDLQWLQRHAAPEIEAAGSLSDSEDEVRLPLLPCIKQAAASGAACMLQQCKNYRSWEPRAQETIQGK
jgi:hypothetical protein